MDFFLSKITQHAMNYAIRSGITVTATFAISQIARLRKTVDDNADYRELVELQERLNSKIQIISPAIDMIELISARGNTTLESSLATTKDLRWEIQALGGRLSKAASDGDALKSQSKTTSRAAHEKEIRLIIQDIKKLITKIDDNVPFFTLAISMSGATLTTSLPATVSPSRLLQASTFLTAGDTQYSMNPGIPVQVGPPFTLTLWMLFTAHTAQMHDDESKKPNWKEVMHKARVKLIRVPLEPLLSNADHDGSLLPSIEGGHISGEGKQNEYSYRLEIIEDLDDGRAHSYEEGEAPPRPYGDVQLAGIREFLPIHQISKIFYVNTGKILGIEPEGEANVPALLFKRDVNAQAPRGMMQEDERNGGYEDDEDEQEDAGSEGTLENDDNDIDEQIRRESSVVLHSSPAPAFQPQPAYSNARHLPPDLDLEWLALSVYTEEADDSSSEGEQEQEPDTNDDSAYASHRPSSSGEGLNTGSPNLASSFATLNLQPVSSPPPSDPTHPPFPQIRSSLSLLEMLIRLTALQQFQQTSHLSVPDEFLTFFLEESSTTGAGPAADERRRARHAARLKVGFDPYDESPIKRHGEEYQYGPPDEYSPARSRAGTPFQDVHTFPSSPGPYFDSRERSAAQPWLHQSSSRRNSPLPVPLPASSPVSPYRGQRKGPVERVQKQNRVWGNTNPSPLAKGGFGGDAAADADSTMGTSPASGNVPLGHGKEKI